MEIITGENNPLLRKKSQPVEHLTKEIRLLISQMKPIMETYDGIGLAAPQVGISLRIIVCEVEDKFYALINPEIIKTSKKTVTMTEGCLSLPNIYGDVERPERIIVKAINQEGEKIKFKAFGLLSRVIQHEVDHLDGILFIDKAKNIIKTTEEKNLL
ncbi:MAG: peptide deformylase [Minisyncoccia bacterium]